MSKLKYVFVVLFFISILLISPQPIKAFYAPVDTFNSDGSIEKDFEQIRIDTGGNVIGIASEFDGGVGATAIKVYKYSSSGTLDGAFGSSGVYTFPFESNAKDVFITSAGKIMIVGSIQNSTKDMVVIMLTSTGVLDTTFNTTGYRVISDPLGEGDNIEEALYVLEDSNSKVVVAGHMLGCDPDEGCIFDLVMLRFNANGTFDNSFSGDGIYRKNFGSFGTPEGLATYNGEYFVSGILSSYGTNFRIAKIQNSGGLDTTFATNGIFEKFFNGKPGWIKAVTVDSSGRPIGVGEIYKSTTDAVIVRLTTSGILDTSFSSDGIRTFDNIAGVQTGNYDSFVDIEIDDNGRLNALAKSEDNDGVSRASVVQLNTDGSLNTDFHTQGIFVDADGLGYGYTHFIPSNFVFDGDDFYLNGYTFSPGVYRVIKYTDQAFPAPFETVFDTKYYFPAYRWEGANKKAWILIGNPSNSVTANITVNFSGGASYNESISPKQTISLSYPGVAGEAVEISSDQDIYATLKSIVDGSVNEFPGIANSSLSDTYYYPAYRWENPNKKAWIVVGNPSASTTANVQVFANGVLKDSQAIAPGDRYSFSFQDVQGEYIKVVSDIDVYTTQKAIVDGSLNEFAGISQTATNFYFPAYRWDAPAKKAWVIIGNPSTTTTANINVYANGIFKGNYNISPEERLSLSLSDVKGEAIEITSSINVYATLKAVVDGSLNEYAGLGEIDASDLIFYPAYRWESPSKFAWIILANSSDVNQTYVEIWLNNQLSSVVSLEPGERKSIAFKQGVAGQNVEIRSDALVYSTLKILVDGSLNEYAGIGGAP